MALTPGTRVGHYEITGTLGAGGMGEVYRATDTNLKREVAIKILPPAFAEDADRVARFQREAEALAALNHSNIAQVFGLERSAGSTAIAMELVEGPTLADRIAQGPIPYDEALGIALQVADALEAAHGKGIVHRDLKPANIKLKPDGTVKVLDFGIATAPESPLATSGRRSPALLTPALTEVGVLLGTAAYMAPEQARGRAVDDRADIWAFGCVLYEMLTGQPAFGGEDVTTTLARILERDAKLDALPAGVPSAAREALRLCLRKEVKDRLADIRDVRLVLRGTFDQAPAPQTKWQWIAASVLGVAIAGIGAWNLKPTVPSASDSSPGVTRFHIDLVSGQRLSGGFPMEELVGFQRPSRHSFALSPDGRYLVYASTDGQTQRLFKRRMDEQESTPIAGTEGGVDPFFAPDSRSVGFWVGSELKRVPIDGGEVRTIAATGAEQALGFSASWTESDTLLVTSASGDRIYELPATGGELVERMRVDLSADEQGVGYPQMLPQRRALLFNVSTGERPSEWAIVVESPDGGYRKVVVDGGSQPVYVPTGHILFARDGSLLAVPFDATRLEATGAPVVIVEDVMHGERGGNAGLNGGAAQFSVSTTGSFAYVAGGIYPRMPGSPLVWINRKGEAEPVPLPSDRYIWPRFSPDGTRLVYGIGSFGDFRLWVYDIGLEVPLALTAPPTGDSMAPVWSPRGDRVVFYRLADAGLFSLASDGSGRSEQIAASVSGQPSSWSSDNVLAFVATSGGIRTLRMDGASEPEPFGPASGQAFFPHFSPDGKWVVYQSSETGNPEVYVRSFPDDGPVHRISVGGGFAPLWSRDGTELFYLATSPGVSPGPRVPWRMMVVDVETEPTFKPTQPRVLFERPIMPCVPVRCYDISPDGERFVATLPPDEPEAQRVTSINIVLNWFEELRERAPAR